MRALSVLFLLTLAACIPAYSDATPNQLSLERNGDTYTLHSDKPIERGSIGIRAKTVTSPLCAVKGCLPDAEGRIPATTRARP